MHRRMRWSELEKGMGMKEGDTAVEGVSDQKRQELIGNAIVPAFLAAVLGPTIAALAGPTTAPKIRSAVTQSDWVYDGRPLLDAVRELGREDPDYRARLAKAPEDAAEPPASLPGLRETLGEGAPGRDVRVGDLLYERDADGLRLVVPDVARLKQHICYRIHDGPTTLEGGHVGPKRMVPAVRRHFAWKGLVRYVRDYCSQCPSASSGRSTSMSHTRRGRWRRCRPGRAPCWRSTLYTWGGRRRTATTRSCCGSTASANTRWRCRSRRGATRQSA